LSSWAAGGGAKAAAAAVREAKRCLDAFKGRNSTVLAAFACDLLINATPVGMFPNVDDTPGKRVASAPRSSFDMVYNPHGNGSSQNRPGHREKTTIPGMRMLLAQAARQFEIWTKQTAPREIYAAE
jgi:shikimate 5-dehydrogenase